MTCRGSADLGAYVLGALAPAERSAVERHVAGCPQCTAELVQLAPLPGLLRHTPFEELEEPAAPEHPRPGPGRPPALQQRVLLAVGAALSAIGIVVAVLLIGVGGSGTAGAQHQAAHRASTITMSHTDPTTHVSASMDLTAESWGTSLRLKLANLPPGVVCRLVVHARDGRSETSGSWASDYGSGPFLTIPASTSISPQDITGLDVVTGTDSVLVQVP